MSRIFAIGDLHGCADELCDLLDHLRPAADDTLVFLGDYIDRGPASKSVVDRLLALERQGPTCIFLKGNHEDMFLDFIGLGGHHGEFFLYNGGAATLNSYGLGSSPCAAVAEQLPRDHLAFFRPLRSHHREGESTFVHAGIRPGVPLERQSEEDLYWIREEFLGRPHGLACTVLFGHTPHREVFLHLPYQIGLDTGLVYGNKLSCFETGEKILYQIRRGESLVEERSLRAAFPPS